MIYFYTPWKRQKIFGFLKFSGAVEMQYSAKMGWLAETFWSVNFAQIFHKFAGCQTFHFHRAYRSSLNFTFNISVLKRMMVLRGPEITLRNEFFLVNIFFIVMIIRKISKDKNLASELFTDSIYVRKISEKLTYLTPGGKKW